jgi:hypothetical protein
VALVTPPGHPWLTSAISVTADRAWPAWRGRPPASPVFASGRRRGRAISCAEQAGRLQAAGLPLLGDDLVGVRAAPRAPRLPGKPRPACASLPVPDALGNQGFRQCWIHSALPGLGQGSWPFTFEDRAKAAGGTSGGCPISACRAALRQRAQFLGATRRAIAGGWQPAGSDNTPGHRAHLSTRRHSGGLVGGRGARWRAR